MFVDLSIVLNVHNEEEYISNTLLSIDSAINYAQNRGISCELLIVLDNANSRLKEKLSLCLDSLTIKAITKCIDVNFGSLGPSRNVGIEQARGDYIATADADDLVSKLYFYNSIQQLKKMREIGEVGVIFPQFVVGFGQQQFITRYLDSDILSSEDFLFYNPYGSRLVFPKEVFDFLSYKDLSCSSPFAFEDWDLNCNLLALGFKFITIPGVYLYYRQRQNSIMSSESIVCKTIPPNNLFKFKKFNLLKCRNINDRSKTFNQLLSNKSLSVLPDDLMNEIKEFSGYEPDLKSLKVLNNANLSISTLPVKHWGMLFSQTIQLVGEEEFDFIVVTENVDLIPSSLYSELLNNSKKVLLILLTTSHDELIRYSELLNSNKNCKVLSLGLLMAENEIDIRNKIIYFLLLTYSSRSTDLFLCLKKLPFKTKEIEALKAIYKACRQRVSSFRHIKNKINFDKLPDKVKESLIPIKRFEKVSNTSNLIKHIKRYPVVYRFLKKYIISNSILIKLIRFILFKEKIIF